jgi:hypothetical protein
MELFDILSALSLYGHTRNQLRALEVRAIDMLISFEKIGPLQEHTVMFHLIIHIISQAIRWGPPSAVWCYALERIMGHLVRGIKSKRHAEANIMARYRSTLVPNSAFSLPRFQGLEAVLTPSKRPAPVDKFPNRARDGSYFLNTQDFEDLHLLLLADSQCYRRVARESSMVHEASSSPGVDIQRWRPWLEPKYTGSATWHRRSDITLAAAVSAFQFSSVKVVYSGVFFGGDRRTGSKNVVATSEHKHEYSIFTFKHGELSGRVAKILFMFKLEFPDRVQQVPFYAVCMCAFCSPRLTKRALHIKRSLLFPCYAYQEEKAERSSPWQFHFAKVQLLDGRDRCTVTRRPLFQFDSSNTTRIVRFESIGELTVIALHPEPSQAAQSLYMVLPWPRRGDEYAQADHD